MDANAAAIARACPNIWGRAGAGSVMALGPEI
jgi:hypothetical protein